MFWYLIIVYHLGAYDATVQIRATVNGRSLLWCYPIVGIAEAGSALRYVLVFVTCVCLCLKWLGD